MDTVTGVSGHTARYEDCEDICACVPLYTYEGHFKILIRAKSELKGDATAFIIGFDFNKRFASLYSRVLLTLIRNTLLNNM